MPAQGVECGWKPGGWPVATALLNSEIPSLPPPRESISYRTNKSFFEASRGRPLANLGNQEYTHPWVLELVPPYRRLHIYAYTTHSSAPEPYSNHKNTHSIGLRPHPPTPKNERIDRTRRDVTILSSCLAHCVSMFSKLI